MLGRDFSAWIVPSVERRWRYTLRSASIFGCRSERLDCGTRVAAKPQLPPQRKSPTPRGAQELRGIHGAVTEAICVSSVRPFYDRLRAARWRAVIQCAISRAPSRQDIGSAVSLYRSEFLDCLRGAETNSYPNVDPLWDNVIAGPKGWPAPIVIAKSRPVTLPYGGSGRFGAAGRGRIAAITSQQFCAWGCPRFC